MNIGTGLYVRYEVITFSDTIDESNFRLNIYSLLFVEEYM